MDSAATECTINYRRLLILWQEFVQLSVASGGSTHARRTGTHEKDTLYYYRVRTERMSNVRIMMDCMVSEQPTAINRTSEGYTIIIII
jgi:hypothetical protein